MSTSLDLFAALATNEIIKLEKTSIINTIVDKSPSVNKDLIKNCSIQELSKMAGFKKCIAAYIKNNTASFARTDAKPHMEVQLYSADGNITLSSDSKGFFHTRLIDNCTGVLLPEDDYERIALKIELLHPDRNIMPNYELLPVTSEINFMFAASLVKDDAISTNANLILEKNNLTIPTRYHDYRNGVASNWYISKLRHSLTGQPLCEFLWNPTNNKLFKISYRDREFDNSMPFTEMLVVEFIDFEAKEQADKENTKDIFTKLMKAEKSKEEIDRINETDKYLSAAF